MRISQSQALRLGVAASLGLVSATVFATPTITSILTSYSALGTPTALSIAGGGFCAATTGSCATKPTVTLGGTALTVSSATASSVTATFSAAPPDGDYALMLTAGTTGSVTYNLTVESPDKGPTGPAGATGATGAKGATGTSGSATVAIGMIVTDSTANHLYRITSALTGATTAAISVERML